MEGSTSRIDGSSEITIEQIEGLLDLEDLLKSDIGGDEIVGVEGH
jgi:hypothetical protein